MKGRSVGRLCFLANALLAVTGALAEPAEILVDEPDESLESERCVNISRIQNTRVLDERNILFFMRGGKIYRNFLPHRCPGLDRRDPFMYRTTLSRLCDVDVITVLYPRASGFTPGPSCGLGEFYPITEQQAEALETEVERVKEFGLGDLE